MSETPSAAWTVRQVAEYLNVNERTVYRMAERGDLPAFKVGDTWRFPAGGRQRLDRAATTGAW